MKYPPTWLTRRVDDSSVGITFEIGHGIDGPLAPKVPQCDRDREFRMRQELPKPPPFLLFAAVRRMTAQVAFSRPDPVPERRQSWPQAIKVHLQTTSRQTARSGRRMRELRRQGALDAPFDCPCPGLRWRGTPGHGVHACPLRAPERVLVIEWIPQAAPARTRSAVGRAMKPRPVTLTMCIAQRTSWRDPRSNHARLWCVLRREPRSRRPLASLGSIGRRFRAFAAQADRHKGGRAGGGRRAAPGRGEGGARQVLERLRRQRQHAWGALNGHWERYGKVPVHVDDTNPSLCGVDAMVTYDALVAFWALMSSCI